MKPARPWPEPSMHDRYKASGMLRYCSCGCQERKEPVAELLREIEDSSPWWERLLRRVRR